jgi:hypothetical protein
MRTVLSLIFTLLGLSLLGQNSKIDEIKYKPVDFRFDHYPIEYPILTLRDSSKSEQVNSKIKEKTLDHWLSDTDPKFTNILDELKFLNAKDMTKSSKLTGYNYQVIFDSSNLLTIETDAEICDRKIWHINNVFNIDLDLGKILTTEDIVTKGKLDALNHILLNHKKNWCRLVKKEFEEQMMKEDQKEFISKYKYGLSQIEDHLKYYNDIKGFTFKKGEIKFDDGFEFSIDVLNACYFPDYVPLNQKEVFKGILKQKYYDEIYNN